MLLAQSSWLGLHIADWVVLIAYFVLILGIGIWSLTRVKDLSDYFMGGRRFGKISMMFFAFGAGTSSEQAISVVAGTWRAGLAGIWWQFLWLWATPFYWIVAPVMRRMRALTTADFFEHRYNGSTALLYSIYGIIMSIVFIAGGLYASGQMVNALTGGQLDEVARDMDWRVPEIHWDQDKGGFGRGRLIELSDNDNAISDALGRGEVPASIVEPIQLHDERAGELEVTQTQDGWLLTDAARQMDYPVTSTSGKDENGNTVTMLRLQGSGTRRVQGYEFAILAMTALFVLYGMAGGLGAAIITDLIQGVLTIAFSFLLLPFVFNMIGGFGELHSEGEVKAGMFDLVASAEVAQTLGKEPITIFYVFMLSLTALTGIVVQPHIMGVCGAGKTEMEGRVGFTFGNFLKRFCTIAWTFTGLACIVWYLGSQSPLKHANTDAAAFQELSQEDQDTITRDRKLYRDLDLLATKNAFEQLEAAKKNSLVMDGAKNLSANRRQELQKIADDSSADGNLFEQLTDADRQAIAAAAARTPGDRNLLAAKIEYHQLTDLEKAAIAGTDGKFADELFGKAAYDILPTILPGLIGLLLASLLAAVMSTSDAQMVVSSGLFTENIYRRYVARNRSQRHYLWVGRLAGLIIVAVALVLQASFQDVIHALKVIIKTPAAIGISLWIGIVWRGWTAVAVWISTIAAACAWAYVGYGPEHAAKWLPEEMFRTSSTGALVMKDAYQMVCYLVAGMAAGLLTSFFTPRTPEDKLDHFFRLIHTPVKPGGEETPGPCQLPDDPMPQGKKLFKAKDIELPRPTLVGMGGFALAWGCVALIIWLTSNLVKWW